MKVICVVGARPQFVKLAPLLPGLQEKYETLIVHSGQHYDDPLSACFFRDLKLPQPDYNIGAGSGKHGLQTAKILIRIEEICEFEKPDMVIVFGDTNTTLAGALAASKLKFRIAHVEAGMRSFVRAMPEEINRVLTDHLSDILFCSTETAVANLKNEGIVNGVHLVGDLMYDALRIFEGHAGLKSSVLKNIGLSAGEYILVTIHRAENTDDHDRLRFLIDGIKNINREIVFPVHPRTEKELKNADLWMELKSKENMHLVEPVGYLDNIALVRNAFMVLTDSGGMQKETYYFGTPTITLRDETEWVETVDAGINVLLGKRGLDEVIEDMSRKTFETPNIENSAAARIIEVLDNG
ncbi:MAG: UDP-N-acetylglucosamine 2-epimerase (non-hydrolyzing) [candidate division Zixibacteria bacterium]|nr:UDP-N-acetylglucosamine 2-epimerase (non-hydrolyzing) [candidate division Zixibacteria bacterium]